MEEKRLFNGRYFLERLLGRGNFSEVWLAKDTRTNVDVALKIYAPATGLDDHGVDMLSREFALLINVNHKNLLKPLHCDVYERKPYLVLPFCAGGSLQRQVGDLSEHDCWRMLRDVAAGLAFLHAMKPTIIHQDIKPDNIMVGANGDYMITDFGISTHSRSALRKSVSENFKSAGTWAYMGPERFSRENTPIMASDIWSLGATAFEMLTNTVPFGENGGMTQKSGAEIPALPPGFSPDIEKVIDACLSLNTWDRPTAEQLERIASDALEGKPVRLPKEKSKSSASRKLLFGGIAVVVVLALMVAGVFLFKKPSVEYSHVQQCITMLKEPSQCQEGLALLKKYADEGESDCSFLLSRIYFKSLSSSDQPSPTVGEIKNNLQPVPDNKKAFQLLQQSVSQDSTNYKALYELGCDYLGGESRTEAVARDIKKCDEYFSRTLSLARSAGDNYYIDRTLAQMEKYKEYLEE